MRLEEEERRSPLVVWVGGSLGGLSSFPHNAAERADFMFVFCGREGKRERRESPHDKNLLQRTNQQPTHPIVVEELRMAYSGIEEMRMAKSITLASAVILSDLIRCSLNTLAYSLQCSNDL